MTLIFFSSPSPDYSTHFQLQIPLIDLGFEEGEIIDLKTHLRPRGRCADQVFDGIVPVKTKLSVANDTVARRLRFDAPDYPAFWLEIFY